MTQLEIPDDTCDPRNAGYKVDVNRGERIGRVSSEWFSRPADERYLSLSELFAAVRCRAERSRTRLAESARALTHADRLAEAVDLDIAAAGWSPTVDNYLGRVTKARILQAVREAKGEQAAQLMDHLKKGDMAERAEELLGGSGWLPEPLRTPGRNMTATALTPETASNTPLGEELASRGYETAMVDVRRLAEDESAGAEAHAVAAE
jgi:hypothetical protein